MINLERLEANAAERLAYAEGFEGAARLFGRIADLEHAAQNLVNALRVGDDADIARAMDQLKGLLK